MELLSLILPQPPVHVCHTQHTYEFICMPRLIQQTQEHPWSCCRSYHHNRPQAGHPSFKFITLQTRCETHMNVCV